jgi:hypothetical protein
MSIFGKLLLVLSLLAAAGFAYLSVQDWKGRQTLTAAGLRHLILLQGLPLGGQPGDPEQMPTDPEAEVPFPGIVMPGGVPSETVSPELLKAYFAAAGAAPAAADGQVALAGATPVPNQLAEVKRVYALVKAEVEKRDGGAAKALVVTPLLLLQAETIEERANVLNLSAAGAGDRLAALLYAKFDQVINARRLPDLASIGDATADPKERRAKAEAIRAAGVKDEPEQRARVAHLLVHLDQGAAWQKRVLMVVGMRRYVKAVGDQTLRFREMAARVARATAADQAVFVEQYAQLRGLAIQRTQMARDIQETQARLEEQAKKDEAFVAQRETQLAELKNQLAALKAEVDQLLAKQTQVEVQLFTVQREVAGTLEDIYRLEAQLEKVERERYGKKE